MCGPFSNPGTSSIARDLGCIRGILARASWKREEWVDAERPESLVGEIIPITLKTPSGPCALRPSPSSPHCPDQASRGDISHKAQCPADLRESQPARLSLGSFARCPRHW